MTFGLYFPRHRRRDLVVAYLVVNVGVLAVAAILDTTTVGLGVGLGLFGVLSIIRLRSSEITQHELAYYFAALAVGLLAGLSTTLNPVVIALIVLVVAVIAVGDSPRLFRRYRQQTTVMDTAYTDETALRAELERMLAAKVHRVNVLHLGGWISATGGHGRRPRPPVTTPAEALEACPSRPSGQAFESLRHRPRGACRPRP